MSEVRDKKLAYVSKALDGNYEVMNWKDEVLGILLFNDDWSLWVFYPNIDTFFGPDFLKSLASQMEEIQEDDESTWE
jgi:hypothetical protein